MRIVYSHMIDLGPKLRSVADAIDFVREPASAVDQPD